MSKRKTSNTVQANMTTGASIGDDMLNDLVLSLGTPKAVEKVDLAVEATAEPTDKAVEATIEAATVPDAEKVEAAPTEDATAIAAAAKQKAKEERELKAAQKKAEKAEAAERKKAERAEKKAQKEAERAAKKTEPKQHFADKADRIAYRLGDKLPDFMVLTMQDAMKTGDELKAAQDATMTMIRGMSVKVKNRASLLLDYVSGKSEKLNTVATLTFGVLAKDGKIVSGDKGNLHAKLLAKPYSTSAARAMGRNTINLMVAMKVLVAGPTKGEFLPNPESLMLAAVNGKLGLSVTQVAQEAQKEAVVETVSAEPALM